MSFYFYLLLGFIGGIPAGMGMGGGTVTIPLLTLIGKVPQKIAQSANLFAFLPMSVFALREHKKNGFLKTQGVGKIVLPALLTALPFSALAGVLPSESLQKLFGIFLIALAFTSLKKSGDKTGKQG